MNEYQKHCIEVLENRAARARKRGYHEQERAYMDAVKILKSVWVSSRPLLPRLERHV